MALSQQQQEEIKELNSTSSSTKRAMSDELEKVLFQELPVLDHGFVRVIDYMGNDSAVVQSARVSYGKGTKKKSMDAALINYLMRHYHTTPFEMCEIKYHVKLPIFIARQWIRHRTANVNEYSARYSILGKEFYIPEPEQLSVQSDDNKQGRGMVLSPEESNRVLDILKADSELVYEHYQEMLNADEKGEILDPNKSGLTRELARMNLTLNYYTEWYWKIDLHNLLHFVNLRADGHAQYEIRQYADTLLETVKKWVPISYDAFVKYRKNSMHLSEPAIKIVKSLIAGEKIYPENIGMGKREFNEFLSMLELAESDVLSSGV